MFNMKKPHTLSEYASRLSGLCIMLSNRIYVAQHPCVSMSDFLDIHILKGK